MSNLRYNGWDLAQTTSVRKQFGDTEVAVDLVHKGVLPQGWFGDKPQEVHTAITGLCLWDGRWTLELAPADPGNKRSKPAFRTLARPWDRVDAEKLVVERGRIPAAVHIPSHPGDYHRRMIEWQATCMRELNPEVILYHLPVEEYHLYIKWVEKLTGCQQPELHRRLNAFAHQVKELIRQKFGKLRKRIRFVAPISTLNLPEENVEESWAQPYIRPEAFGGTGDRSKICAVEDLVELRIALEATRHGVPLMPVLLGLLGIPHPYTVKMREGDGTQRLELIQSVMGILAEEPDTIQQQEVA